MSSDSARPFVLQAQQALASALNELNAPAPTTVISTPAALDAALATVPPGSVVTLARSLVYTAPLTLKRSVTIQGEDYAASKGVRAKLDDQLPQFTGGVDASGDDVKLFGVECRHNNPLTDIVKVSGLRPVLDRVRILGDGVKGAKRGVAYMGTDGQILNSYIDDIFQPAQDTQAICGWDMGAGLIIDNCYLSAAGQSVMFGGSDPSSEARTPRGIHLTNSTLTKKPAWVTLLSPGKHAQQVKCSLELKNVIDFYAANCVFEFAGTSAGQGGYLFDLTPRNQGNTAPYTSVQNVVIENSTGRFAGGIANCLGSDNINPSGPLANITLRNLSFTDIDPKGITSGTGRLFLLDRAPQHVTLDTIKVTGQNILALGYFIAPPPVGFTVKNMSLPSAKYGWKIDAGGSGAAALKVFMPDAVLDASVV